jgi:hypothetical protein
MPKRISFASAAMALSLAGGCGNSEKTAQLEKENRELNQKLDSLSHSKTLDLQQQCSTQAREEFKFLGWDKQQLASYTNHYNTSMNKCFLEIDNTNYPFVNKTLSDAFEGKVYGEYTWKADKVKKYWEVPPLECKVTLPSGEEYCHSSDEFDELVKKYLNQ